MIHTKNQFDVDITLNGGYLYSEKAQLSSRMANERLTRAVLDSVVVTNRKVLDVGCGDGIYTYNLHTKLNPAKTIGMDISEHAIKIAQNKYAGTKNLSFIYKDVYSLKESSLHVDIAIVRGVIHHVSNPLRAIEAVSHVADEIIILEPNGYNPLLKVIEKISPYHRAHEEKSYFPFQIKKWLKQSGYNTVIDDQYINIVPFFFPDTGANVLKLVEPFIESLPLFSRIMCGVYVIHAKK